MSAIGVLILQREKIRHRVVKYLAQSCTALGLWSMFKMGLSSHLAALLYSVLASPSARPSPWVTR